MQGNSLPQGPLLRLKLWSWVLPLFCLACALVLTEYQAREIVARQQHRQLKQLVSVAGQLRSFIESEVNTPLYLSLGLASHVQASGGQPDPKDTLLLLAGLLEQGKHIRNLALAPDNVLTLVFPVEGNERALGVHYANLPQQWPAIQQIIAEKKARLVGPVSLVQGGKGFIYRVPVFLNDGRYWGLISTVLDLNALWQNLAQQSNSYQVLLALRYAGDTEAFVGRSEWFQDATLTLDLSLRGAQWQMAIRSLDDTEGWGLWQWRLAGGSVSLLFCLMLGWLLFSFRRSYQFSEALQETETYGRRILDAVSDVIITTDLQGRIERMNQAVTVVFGYLQPELLGKDFRLLLQAAEPGWNEGQLPLQETIGVRKSGELFALELSRRETERGGQRRYVWLLRDISARKEVEQLKDEFVSTVSHELRTPLTSINGALGLTLGGVLGPLTDKQQHMLSLAQQNSQRLANLINDLLDIEKLAVNKMPFKFKLWPLQNLLHQSLELNQPVALARQVQLLLDDPDQADAWVEVDDTRFQQLMANLLANAIRHSPVKGQVKIRIELQQTQVTVSVIDQGSGVPPEFVPRLFQKFSQADASDRRAISGTGLGLAICKELVKAMQGEIGYRQTEQGGACFYFRLPLATQLF
ncbi:ATP-binding protein [Rheinheimera sp.]|uniref:ATP-binding protein n=1 Tax=Rheinheimera sp. TaxID=1869214 RepID=UPI00307E8971